MDKREPLVSLTLLPQPSTCGADSPEAGRVERSHGPFWMSYAHLISPWSSFAQHAHGQISRTRIQCLLRNGMSSLLSFCDLTSPELTGLLLPTPEERVPREYSGSGSCVLHPPLPNRC